MNIAEFLDMGGYAFYVWASWGMTVVVIAWNILSPVVQRKKLFSTLQREYRRAERS